MGGRKNERKEGRKKQEEGREGKGRKKGKKRKSDLLQLQPSWQKQKTKGETEVLL